ncbi:MAG: hypothetical protein QM784_40270 [Polyangiaceae bacterium]
MEAAEFRQYISTKSDGYWELLATAVGNGAAVAKSLAGLQGSAFKEGVCGPSGTPSLVGRRVDALAAYRPSLLVEASKTWTKPSEMSYDLMASENDLLFAAWFSSLRFLVPAGTVSASDFRTNYTGICEEAGVQFSPTPFQVSDWNELIEHFEGGEMPHNRIRAMDRYALLLPPADRGMLKRLLGRGKPTAFGRIRIFRERANLTQRGCEVLPRNIVA